MADPIDESVILIQLTERPGERDTVSVTAQERYLASVLRHRRDPDRPGSPTIWSPSLECASRDELEAIQSEKLAAAFAYLFESSSYYRARFEAAGLGPNDVRSIADLGKIPITTKLDWIPDIEANAPWGTFSPLSEARWREAGWMVFSTSGTTRQPRLFRHTTHDRDTWGWMCARALWSFGVRPGDSALNCFFYGPSVAAWGMHHGLERIGCSVIPGGSMNTERRALFVHALRPQALLGTPSAMLALGRCMQELGHDPSKAGVRTIVCAGEPGASVRSTKQRLEQLFDAQIHDDFGCTEVAMAPLGFSCQAEVTREDGPVGVHLMEDALIVEVLDPETYEPVPLGERGSLVVSNLYSESAPILRFDMGDTVIVNQAPCACGRTSARAMGGLLGRNDHCIKIKGLQFFPSTFEDALRSIPGIGDEYRIEVKTREADVVTVVVERTADGMLTSTEIALRLRGILGISVEVSVAEHGTLPRTEGKGVRFVVSS